MNQKQINKLVILNGLFIMSLLVANVVANKVVNIYGLTVPAAVVAYAITFLCTDLIGELYGKDEANRTVKYGFYLQIFSLILISIAIALPPAFFSVEYSEKFAIVLGNSWRVVLASLIAYLISQANDVFVFHKLKEMTGEKYKWIRNNGSTMLSQLIDTAIFITIAFWGVPNLIHMIFSQYIIKFILALLDTPFFYFFTRKKDAERN